MIHALLVFIYIIRCHAYTVSSKINAKHVLVSCTGVIMVHIHVKLGEDRALDRVQKATVRFSFT